ncbi:hypothetical protein [Nocardioides sp. KR10-350]|uniref:hypothetical protein n=1 Tax=Nocardioides cheoyonin TaxID=3156615 RepID=UPI0032B60AB1
MGGELNVDPEALALAAKGIDGTIGELNDMGMLSEGETGRGFGSMALTGMEAGHTGLADTFASFCDRWGWGVRGLVQDANAMAAGLNMSAGIYSDEQTYITGALKVAGASFVADPHATDEQLEKESWGDMVGDATSVDYSGASFEDAAHHAGDTWKATAEDYVDTEQQQMTDPLGYLGGELDGLTGKDEDEGEG